jgi:zinc protease
MITAIDRKQMPHNAVIDKIALPQARRFELDNGIPVYGITAGFQDLVKVEFLYPNLSFNISKPIIHSAANRMLAEGTNKYSAQQLADNIDYYGAFYETEENADFCSVMLYTLNKHLESTLPFLSDIIANPVFPERELEIFKQNNIQRLAVENEKVSSLARRKFNQMIFGNSHPYGYFTEASDYEAIKREDLIDYYRRQYLVKNFTIIVSGMVTDATVNMLNKVFGKLKLESAGTNGKANPAFIPAQEQKNLIEKNDAVQSALRIGSSFFNRAHPDYPGAAFLNTILGGYFGSRLMSNIREEKGYTYGIGSGIVSMKQDGYFFISTEVATSVTADAINEIYKEVELLRVEEVEEEEMAMVRNYLLGSFLKGCDGAFHLAERFKSIYLYGLDYEYYDRYLEKIRTIAPDEIKMLAQRYFDTSGFFECVVGRK